MKHVPLLVALALATITLPGRAAEACACCDGYTRLRVVGWSKSGRSVLLERDSALACEVKSELVVMRLDDKRVVKRLPVARKASLARWFPQRPRALAKKRWRLSRVGNSKQWLRVFVRRGKRWARVWQRVVTPYRYESPKDGSTTLYQPTVRVLRPARGRFALLMVEHVETMPGIGHHATLALSVRLDPS